MYTQEKREKREKGERKKEMEKNELQLTTYRNFATRKIEMKSRRKKENNKQE